jgi:hypothetical protein
VLEQKRDLHDDDDAAGVGTADDQLNDLEYDLDE